MRDPKGGVDWGDKDEFSLRQIKFEMSTRHLSREINQGPGYARLGVQAAKANVGPHMVFKAQKMTDMTRKQVLVGEKSGPRTVPVWH